MSELIERDEKSAGTELPSTSLALNPSQLLALAVQQGADLDRLERLMALQERWEANEARKAYAEAFAQFKLHEVVQIFKDKHVRYQGSKGITEYDHATIGNVVEVITAAISKYGFSHSWKTRQEKSTLYVTCILRHKAGHSETVELSAEPDASGGKNAIQAVSSANTYLQRITLQAITGCATRDQPDDDGRGAGGGRDGGGGKGGADAFDQAYWIEKVHATKDDGACMRVYTTAVEAATAAKDRFGFEKFKEAAVAHRKRLRNGDVTDVQERKAA